MGSEPHLTFTTDISEAYQFKDVKVEPGDWTVYNWIEENIGNSRVIDGKTYTRDNFGEYSYLKPVKANPAQGIPAGYEFKQVATSEKVLVYKDNYITTT